MGEPVNTVIIPVVDGARYVGEAIASVLPQIGADDEVLVIDNGSTDDTQALVAGHPDPRVRLLHAARRGPAAARNVGLREMRGRFVSFLDHDDMWAEGRLAGLHAALAGTPGADAAHGRLRLVMEVDEPTALSVCDGQHAPMVSLMVYLFRREILERIGPMDETMMYGEDTDYLVRLILGGMSPAVYDGVALLHRRHDGNMTRNRAQASRGMLGVLARNIARTRAARQG